MKIAKVLLTIILSLIWMFVQSQERCATVPYNELLNQKFNGMYEVPLFEKWIRDRIQNKKSLPQMFESKEEQVYLIPVVIHVIHNGEAEGVSTNISDEQILSQILVLNEDYRRLNGDTINTPEVFKSVATDTHIEFKLAERDPEGQETDGIVRVQGTKSEWSATDISDNQELKSLSFWPPEDYLNIWVTNLSNNFLGYAQYPITDLPGSVPPFDRETDGVVIHYRAFGSRSYGTFNLFNNYDRGRTTTHEIGHYFGLRHIWGDVIGCDGTDYCSDTPNAFESYTSCTNIDPFSCDSEDMYQNYLDYSYDRCMNIFTVDQAFRMRTVIENSPRRKSLLTSPGLIPPQNQFNLLVIREILNPTDIGCVNSFEPVLSVQNNGLNDVLSFTVILTLDTSPFEIAYIGDTIAPGEVRLIDPTPQIGDIVLQNGQYYLNAGIRNVNDVDSVELSEYDIEKIFLVNSYQDIAPSIEKFEVTDFDMTLWSVYNPDNDVTWQIEDLPIDQNVNRAPGVKMYEYFKIAATDWLVSPVIDLSENIDANITFNFSYADGNGTEDILDLRVSTDCGATWPFTIFSASGNQLITGEASGPWVPTGSEDWKKGYADLQQFIGEEQVRLAFITTNLNGNNLYLDNIEMFVTGFTQDISLNENAILLHPNPTENGNFYVSVKTDERQDVIMQVIDMNGKIILDKDLLNVLNQTFEFSLTGVRSGVYILKATGKTYHQTTRLIINR
jgi:hypothetical protein